MKLTRLQKTTLIAILAYLAWEVTLQFWAKSVPELGPIIRVDLLIIIPIISFLIIANIVPRIRGKQTKVIL